MVIGGYSYSKGSLADVELLSLDPTTNPVPECQAQPSPLAVPIRAAGGAIDYTSKSTFRQWEGVLRRSNILHF